MASAVPQFRRRAARRRSEGESPYERVSYSPVAGAAPAEQVAEAKGLQRAENVAAYEMRCRKGTAALLLQRRVVKCSAMAATAPAALYMMRRSRSSARAQAQAVASAIAAEAAQRAAQPARSVMRVRRRRGKVLSLSSLLSSLLLFLSSER